MSDVVIDVYIKGLRSRGKCGVPRGCSDVTHSDVSQAAGCLSAACLTPPPPPPPVAHVKLALVEYTPEDKTEKQTHFYEEGK